jgi:hypothetical protein
MIVMYANWGPGTTDIPDIGNVLDDDTSNGSAGTFANIATGDVRDGEFWGEDGTEYEGSLEVTGTVGIFFLCRRK